MKKYQELEIQLIVFQTQDILTESVSGEFGGDDHDFGDPNKPFNP